ncbi:MAG: SMI1/KNR4 family protein [Janthinobacterium lividum]
MSDFIATVAHQYQFELPALYRRLYSDGMLDWGLPSANWYAEVFPRLRERPPALLFSQDFELYMPEQVLAVDPQDWGPTYQFVPLGQTGGGDLYAFCPSLTAHGETPVTLSLHDANETTVLASSLEAFIFRQMLDRATAFDKYDLEGYANFDELRTDLQRAALTIRPYLRPTWYARLTEVYARLLQPQTIVLPRQSYTIDALLPQAEFEEILRQEINFTDLNTTFAHFSA